LLGSLLSATAAQATTYVRVEKDGTKTYSDRPLPGGQPVEVQPAQTYSAPATQSPTSSTRSREQQEVLDAANFQYACAISPRADESFQNPESITLGVQLTPGLRPGDLVNFSLDGTTVPNEANSTSATVQFPDRGTHTAAVRITDRSGRTVCSTSSTFHVQRSNLNSPARRPAPTPRPTPRPGPPPKG
jgi:hypothetical protein